MVFPTPNFLKFLSKRLKEGGCIVVCWERLGNTSIIFLLLQSLSKWLFQTFWKQMLWNKLFVHLLFYTGFLYWNESFSSKSNETAAFWHSEVLHLPIKQLLLCICFLFLADSFTVEMHDTAALKKWVERCTMKLRSTNLGSIIFFSNLCHASVWRVFLPN